MSPSSAPSSSSQSDTLRKNEIIIEEHPKDTLRDSIDSLSSPEDTRSTILNHNRSAARDVHIFDASDRGTSIGGLILTAGVTNTNFYAMIEIFVIFNGEYILLNESGTTIEKDDSPLLPGNYYIDSLNPIQINNETVLTRMISIQTGTRIQAFCDAVRSRDRRCVITREEYLDDDEWWGFAVAHIFPLAYEQYWTDHNYGHWISSGLGKGGTINSVQNGLLFRDDIHQGFVDSICISSLLIQMYDNYKIVCFSRDRKGIAGKYFDQRPLDDPQRPADQLLRWHFRQAVLTNMKGAGEPTFEHDFPPGSDMAGNILKGPKAAERMQFELFTRLATQVDLTE